MSDVIYVENDNGLNVILNELETEINPEGYIFVRNGEKEIDSYVQNILKPDLDVYSQNRQNDIENTINTQVDAAVVQLNNFTNSECQTYISQTCQDKKNEIAQFAEQSQDAYASFVDEKNQEVENIVTQADAAAESATSSKNAAASSATSSSNYSNNSKVWAEGSDSQVQALGGVHSAKGWAEEMDVNNFVHKTGNETIEGVKTFKNSVGQIYAKSDNVDWTADSISTSSGCGGLYFFDKNQNITGYIQPAFYTNKNRQTELCCRNSDGKAAYIGIGFNSSGSVFTKAPTPPTSDNSTQIATTAWVRQVAALKDLSNVSSNIDYIIEQGGDNYQWYRIYKSGRLEQGGIYDNGTSASNIRKQITLLKPYQYQSYIITVTPMSGGCRGTVSGKIVSTTALELQYTGDYGVFDEAQNCRYLSWKTDEAKGN